MSESVSGGLTDPSGYLMALYEGADSAVVALVESELKRIRCPQGGYVMQDTLSKSDGPLYLLQWICAGDWITLNVWARNDGLLSRRSRDNVERNLRQIKEAHGMPVAAACVRTAWGHVGQAAPPIEVLDSLLVSGYEEWQLKVTGGMVRDSLQKWNSRPS